MAQQTFDAVSFDNDAGQCWITFDDVSGDLLTLRLVNNSPNRSITFNAKKGTRPPQAFTAAPGQDQTFVLPTGQAAKYSFVRDAAGVWQTNGFVTWVQYG